MDTWVHLPEVEQTLMAQPEDFGTLKADASSILQSIPPERVGLSGEYDHSGLAKRVMLAFQEHIDAVEVARIQVIQRGRVVILVGMVTSQLVLNHLITIALSVNGADTVEAQGVEVRSLAPAEPASLSF